MSTIWVFGYASLNAASGINGRGMRRKYRPRDLTECILPGYRRQLNAVYQTWDHENARPLAVRYFGVTKQDGHSVNGVVFPIDKRDIDAFVRSEGGTQVYTFVDVTNALSFDGASPIKPGDKVYTCVPKHPSLVGIVTKSYIKRCTDALSQRSPSFQRAFGEMNSYL